MATTDIQHEFYLIPDWKADRSLIGIHWRSKYYVDKCFPFGLCSAPYPFNS